MDKKIILFDSDEAARVMTVTGWVSSIGHFFEKDENTARYDGCTHRKCGNEGCNNITEKSWTACEACKDKANKERYKALPEKEWDYETPLVIYNTDIYFWDEDGLLDYCDENECEPSDLQLVFCVPQYAHPIRAEDICGDNLPEDGEVPDELERAVEELNQKIQAYKTPLSWTEGKIRAVVTEEVKTKQIGEKIERKGW